MQRCDGLCAAAAAYLFLVCGVVFAQNDSEQQIAEFAQADYDQYGRLFRKQRVQYGNRPAYLIDGMDSSRLKRQLQACADQRPRRTDFSIGHRGAPLQFPEHTKESYIAAARQGAGILECDVSFTKRSVLANQG